MWLFKLKSCDYSNRFLKSINSLWHAFFKIKLSLIKLIIKWWKKSSKQLFDYKFLEDIQMKCYKQKIVRRVLRVWITKNPKRNNEIISLNFLILYEKVCLSYIQISLYSLHLDIVAGIGPLKLFLLTFNLCSLGGEDIFPSSRIPLSWLSDKSTLSIEGRVKREEGRVPVKALLCICKFIKLFLWTDCSWVLMMTTLSNSVVQ